MGKVHHSTKPTGQETLSSGEGSGREHSSCNLAGKIATPLSSQVCLRELDAGTRILAGNAGDHALVLQLLVEAYQCPLAEDFQSRLDEPSYQPTDRLLLQRDGRFIGHVQMSKQIGWFQGQRCPLVKLQDFVTLPEYRSVDFDKALLEVAERTAISEGSVLALVQTDRPEWFEQQGWGCFRGQGYTRANTRAILSHFDVPKPSRRRRNSRIEIRTWRHFELDGLRRVYQQVSTNMWGPLYRSEETWQWLMGRKSQDQILIATEKNPEKPCGLTTDPNVVGYAIVRDSCIVEMLTLPGFSTARAKLVARACRDAIDRDHHYVSLHTPAADPMHELLVTAGGSWISDSATSGGKWMFKLLAPDRWVERFYPVYHERARETGIQRPLEIDFTVGETKWQLTVTRRSSRLQPTTSTARPLVQCDWQTFQDLLASNLTFPEALAQGRLRTAHRSISSKLAALFPPKLFWQSPFELLRL